MKHTPEGLTRIRFYMTVWTPDQDRLLTKLWNEGKTARAIADHFPGKSRNSVIGRVHRLRSHGVTLKDRPQPPRKSQTEYTRAYRARLREKGLWPAPVRRGQEAIYRPPKPKPIPLPPIQDTLEGSVGLFERTGCAWPVTARPPHRFCNKPCEGSYCDGHKARLIASREMRPGKYEVPFR